jgi:hypothetical protein
MIVRLFSFTSSTSFTSFTSACFDSEDGFAAALAECNPARHARASVPVASCDRLSL